MNAARERRIGELWLVTNHWGWTLRGIITWIRYGWGFFERWGVEERGSVHSRSIRLLKIGPICTRTR